METAHKIRSVLLGLSKLSCDSYTAFSLTAIFARWIKYVEFYKNVKRMVLNYFIDVEILYIRTTFPQIW